MPSVETYDALAVITGILEGQTWYGSWATGTTEAARGAHALDGEATENRQVCSLTQTTISVPDDTLEISYTMTCNATAKTIRQAGVLTLSAAGVLLFLSSFPGEAVVDTNSITFKFRYRLK